MRADGYVIIDTKILDDGIEKGFEALKTEVSSVGQAAEEVGEKIKLSFAQTDVSRPVQEAQNKIKNLEAQLASVTSEYKFAIAEDDDKGAEKLARKMTSIYDQLEKARERLAREVEKAAIKQAKAEEKAAEKARKAAEKEAKAKEKAMNKAYRDATKGARRFGSRFREILSGAIIFNAVSRSLREMTSYFGEALKTNEKYRTAVGRLKGAILTAFQPIYEYVLPAIVNMINYLTSGAQAVARFFATLSGKSVQQMAQNAEAMYNEAKGIEKVGKEAKKAKRELMGFDELNRLSEKETATTNKGETSDTIAPIFGDMGEIGELPEWLAGLKEKLLGILDIVASVAAALVTWEIAKKFMTDLTKAKAIALLVGGAVMFVYNWIDALMNGLNWENFGGMLIGLGVALLAVIKAFSPTVAPYAAAITLLVSGIGMVVLGMKEWIETGELSTEACATLVAGIMAIGAAFTILTGAWIPLLVAAIVGLLVVAAKNADKIKAKLNKFGEWLKGVFCRDWTEVFGDILGTKMNIFVDVAGGVLRGLKDILFGILDVVTGVFTLNWKKVWEGLGSIVKGAVNGIIGVLNGMIRAVVTAVNKLLGLTFGTADKVSRVFGGKGISIPSVKVPQIPYLATGAVIPPNAPFMAVLGDQRHGTNIEAPEELIRKIVREESGTNSETIAVLRAILAATQASKNTHISIGDRELFEVVVDANNRATRIYGQSPLKV